MSRERCGRFYFIFSFLSFFFFLFLKNGETRMVRRTYFRKIPTSIPISSSFFLFHPLLFIIVSSFYFILHEFLFCIITLIFMQCQIIFLLIAHRLRLHLNYYVHVYLFIFYLSINRITFILFYRYSFLNRIFLSVKVEILFVALARNTQLGIY